MAKFYFEFQQRSAAWVRARLAIPTASDFHKILTAGGKDGKDPKPSTQAEAYMDRLLAEYVLGEPLEEESFQSPWMELGCEIEPEAVKAFEFQTGYTTKEVGFVTTDDGLIGASPDRLVLNDNGDVIGTLEVKSVAPQTQISLLLDQNIGQKYRVQMAGQLYVCEVETSWICSHHRRFPPVIYRQDKDPEFQGKLHRALRAFVNVMVQRREELKERFGLERPELEPEPQHVYDDFDGLGITDEDLEAILNARERV